MTNQMINDITVYTNIFRNKNKFPRERDAKTRTPMEIRAVLGVIYMAGVLKSSHTILEDLYATDGTDVDFFICSVSIKRLKFFLKCLRFDDILYRKDNSAFDKLAPVRDLLNNFVFKSQENVSVSEFITVDKMLEAICVRCSFRQYIKSKL